MLNPWTSQGTAGKGPHTLHYRLRAGSSPQGRRVVLIHSLGLDATLWNEVAAHLPESITVCAYDCRGHGLSGAGALPYSMQGFAEDLRRLLDHLGWPDVELAGCSMGGCIAMEFAARHPQRVAVLTLIDTTAWYGPESAQLWSQRAQMALDAGMRAMGERQVEQWFSRDFRDNSPAIVQDLLQRFGRTAPACFSATCVMLGTTDLRSGLARLAHPTLVIVGGEDALTPPSASQALADAIPGAQLTVLDGARHLTPAERAQEVALLLVR